MQAPGAAALGHMVHMFTEKSKTEPDPTQTRMLTSTPAFLRKVSLRIMTIFHMKAGISNVQQHTSSSAAMLLLIFLEYLCLPQKVKISGKLSMRTSFSCAFLTISRTSASRRLCAI